MMKVSAPAGLSDSSAEQPQERPFRPGVGAGQRRVGRAGRPLRPEDGRQDHHDDHGQRREQASFIMASPRKGTPLLSCFS